MSCSFIADAMLGHVAKWLRILGYDTRFDPALDDHQLVRLARAENRILLTRDQELARRRGVRALLLAPAGLEDQLRQVVHELDLACDRPWSRCPRCNVLLMPIDVVAARARVPLYVAETQDHFQQCPACQRVYWRGTHWQEMAQVLARLRCETPSADRLPTATRR